MRITIVLNAVVNATMASQAPLTRVFVTSAATMSLGKSSFRISLMSCAISDILSYSISSLLGIVQPLSQSVENFVLVAEVAVCPFGFTSTA